MRASEFTTLKEIDDKFSKIVNHLKKYDYVSVGEREISDEEFSDIFEIHEIDGIPHVYVSDADISMSERGLSEIPIPFGEVTGDFRCGDNPIKSLKNAPFHVGGDFDCSDTSITSFEHVPEYIGGELIAYNTKVIDFKGCENIKIRWHIYCAKSSKLESLEGIPNGISGITCTDCPKLTPYEMRHLLFCNLFRGCQSDHREADELINEFMDFKKRNTYDEIAEEFMRIVEELENME